jgi:hypothetical protein
MLLFLVGQVAIFCLTLLGFKLILNGYRNYSNRSVAL